MFNTIQYKDKEYNIKLFVLTRTFQKNTSAAAAR